MIDFYNKPLFICLFENIERCKQKIVVYTSYIDEKVFSKVLTLKSKDTEVIVFTPFSTGMHRNNLDNIEGILFLMNNNVNVYDYHSNDSSVVIFDQDAALVTPIELIEYKIMEPVIGTVLAKNDKEFIQRILIKICNTNTTLREKKLSRDKVCAFLAKPSL